MPPGDSKLTKTDLSELYCHHPDQINEIGKILYEIFEEYYSNTEEESVYPREKKTKLVQRLKQDSPPEQGVGFQQVLNLFKDKILPASVRTWHPLFLNQNFAGAPLPSVVADALSSMLNTTLATWEAAPAATIIEKDLCSWLAQLLGMKKGSGGIILPGGSLSNMFGLFIARERTLSRLNMASGERLTVICSNAAHYSIESSARLLGLASDSVYRVKTNERGEMLPDELEQCIELLVSKRKPPIAVVATLGTTVTGGFDPLDKIAPICKKHTIHLHVDAAFGGSMALSPKTRFLFSGIEEANTVIWDAHKWLHVPLVCSALLVPNTEVLKQTFSHKADYLFHQTQDGFDEYEDLGKSTFLCGKRFDSFKVWFFLQAYGVEHFRSLVEQRLSLTEFINSWFGSQNLFLKPYQAISPIVCFRYNPKKFLDGHNDNANLYLDKLHRWVREEAKGRGIAFFNLARISDASHFRLILINPLTEKEHFLSLMKQIETLCHEFEEQHPFV